MQNSFIQKYQDDIQGVISCYDRVLIRGTLHSVSHAGAMTNLMYRRGVLLKDYKTFVAPYRNQIHEQAKLLANQEDVPIIVIRKVKKVRKEDLVAKQLKKRGTHPGLVCILSAMEGCETYQYRYDKSTGRSFLVMTSGKCTHYYYYFIDKHLGLCYLRVPTWCPFRLQFYFNAHNWLARQLDKAGIDYELRDNAFTDISDFEKAQSISDSFDVRLFHKRLDHFVDLYCPQTNQLCNIGYRWTIMQIEYATDIIFKNQKALGPIYDHLLKTMMHTVQPSDVARFLSRKDLHGKNNLPLDTSYKQVRHEMRRIKHSMGRSSIKIYDKFSQILRIETTTYDPTEFYHYRSVAHRDGTKSSKVASVKKNIYSIKPLATILGNCNKRYLKYIAAFDAPTSGKKRFKKLTKTTKVNNRSYRGINFFDQEDENLLRIVANGDFIINGFKNKDLRTALPNKKTGQISRILKRLTVRGLIRKINKTYKYYVTTLGHKIIVSVLNVKEHFFIKQLAY
jgi:hypothetical protein